ncbi:MAG: hypothetical protein WB679_08660 [Terracidiphilus sp.]
MTSCGIRVDSLHWIRNQISSLFLANFWDVGIVHAPIHRFLDPDFRPDVDWLSYSGGNRRFIADPFLFNKDGKPAIMMEEFDYGDGSGRIIEGKLSFEEVETRIAIAEDCHMSYPYVFNYRDRIFCTPETYQKNQIALYSFDPIRAQWEKERVLVDGVPACDPTVIRYDNHWWMFFTRSDDLCQKWLFIYHSEDLCGLWIKHPSSPVNTSRASCRSGGTPFIHEGQLYRPAQDLSVIYGGGIAIKRVVEISTTGFREEVVRQFKTLPGVKGEIHTLSGLENLTAVDSLHRRLAWRETPRMITHKVRKLFGAESVRTY